MTKTGGKRDDLEVKSTDYSLEDQGSIPSAHMAATNLL